MNSITEKYIELLGYVPPMIAKRQKLAEITRRETAIQAIEQLRDELIHNNPLDRKTQQLVHLAMLIAIGAESPARLHARAALKAGASPSELEGVAETAAIACGMPGFGLAIEVIFDAIEPYGDIT